MKRAFLIALLLPLAGCGFHPLYGDLKLAPQLSSIYVDPIPDSTGYELRNSLIDLLRSDGSPGGKVYHLSVSLSDSSQGVALQNDAAITRYNDTLTANYVLTGADGKQVTSGSLTSLSSYNVATSPFATLSARQDSDKRAAEDLARRIALDLGVFFRKSRP